VTVRRPHGGSARPVGAARDRRYVADMTNDAGAAPRQPARYDDDLRLAHVIADQVDAQTMARFKALDLHVESKPDTSPVTDADRRAEEIVRRQLPRTRPRDSLLGE